ncbi:hypothetical protein RX327_02775 [Bradyrhizobium sp. BEA-2-5]|uniref:hypothetical protein n=1 Tax=Bradyrhizobium sp. BEA-2-5 TaxID=3080015 RepID=UPI00293E9F65|nr:hypothetical protein [Bradyrhizobium sp. BEA-2-5]WOH82140.1 hypothetical protein RX327_02775 [Bradyrhizobium sp. BEA-2-5]
MIKIKKPVAGPARLSAGPALVTAFEREIAQDPNAGASSKPFKFDQKIYGHSDVKNALKAAQHDKCCYCEAHISHIAAGHVEHYRPKTCSQQAKGEQLLYPGYYWLAYAWLNLYFVCERCNSSGKKNLFPLRDPARRKRRRTDRRIEQPMILDPGGAEDPRNHIRFNKAAVVGTSDLGKATIKALGLDRIALTTDRLRHLKKCIAIRDFAKAPSSKMDPDTQQRQREARDLLARLAARDAEYSAMVMDLLAAR